MNTKQNLHTHTTFCDGRDTPEEMIKEAISRGFGSLGFSGHSFRQGSTVLKVDRSEDYKKEILRLKEAYRGVIDVFLGIEYEIFSDCTAEGYEYVIGSAHCFKTENGVRSFDRDLKGTLEFIDEVSGGDPMRFAREYYSLISDLPSYGRFDIIGHFDLITKNIEERRFLDVESKEYLDCALGAVHALKGRIPFFEVNTGAVARGYRTSPYPQLEILKELKDCGFGAVITSDCHDKRYLDAFFEESREILKEVGFSSRYVFDGKGFQEVEI